MAMRYRRPSSVIGLVGVIVFSASCSSSAPRIPSTTAEGLTYRQACENEGSVCISRDVEGAVPAALLDRRLRIPVLDVGATCPTTRGSEVNGPSFGGVAFGGGPVRLVVAQNGGNLQAGEVDLTPSDTVGWPAFKTLWVSAPDYQGPVLVRARQIGGVGHIAMLGGATAGPLVIPPGPTLNDFSGNRTAPEGTYVSSSGCFDFQVDGTGFSESIVLSAAQDGRAPSA
jgi:hypothetical protein